MKDFDEKMKQRAQSEQMCMNPEAEARLQSRLERAPEPRKRRELEVPMIVFPAIAGVAAALILMMAVFMQPTPDCTLGVLPHEGALPQLVPVTQGEMNEKPIISSDAAFTGDAVQLTTWLDNPLDDDIWLVALEPELEGAQQQPGRVLIWLEPGAMCSHSFEWRGVQGGEAAPHSRYAAYRVTAHTLHWFEEEALLQDAFDAGALIVNAGDWANGEAGEVTLLLPQGQPQDPLAYYAEKGMLTKEAEADEAIRAVKEP